MRTLLPTADQLLLPEVATNVEKDIQHRRQRAKQQYDKGAKQLPPLIVGQTIRLQPVGNGEKWKKATVLKKVGERSYLVKTTNGQIYRRNRKFLRSTNESIEQDDLPSTDEDAADELYVPTTEDHQMPTNLTDDITDDLTTPEQPRDQPENAIVTRTGRVVKPSSRYKDFVKLQVKTIYFLC